MLNELHELAASIQESRIDIERWHKDYGTCPKTKTFRLFVAKGGAVADIEPIESVEKIKRLRKWEVSNGTSFPAFNVLPLLKAATEKAKGDVANLKRVLQSEGIVAETSVAAAVEVLAGSCERLWVDSEIKRINDCLKLQPKKLRQILGPVPAEFNGLEELILRAMLLDARKLEEDIRRSIIQQVVREPSTATDWIDSLLVASTTTPKKVSLVLELADSSRFKYPVNHEEVQAWINSRLMAQGARQLSSSAPSLTDAFGQPFAEEDSKEKFDDAELDVLGKVVLRAMSSEIPCQARYGSIDAESFPCGRQMRTAMKASLEWLGSPIRRGKTWQNVSRSCGYDRGILFAYPSALSLDPPELASLFAMEEREDRDGARFEAAAARVTSSLQGIARARPDAEIRVFVLAKPDGYRTKILVSRKYSAEHMIIAAQAWQEGCRNVPPVNLNIGTSDSPKWIAPSIPFPDLVVRCLNITWLQAGTRTKPVHGLGLGDGIGLLMEAGITSQAVTDHALRLAVANAAPLLLALGHADHRLDGSFKWNKDTAKHEKHASLLPSLLGLLLYKLNQTKGGYMGSAPFMVGQALALADILHREYCQHVRNGSIPPQLIGNALMPVALVNPIAGLARLSERLTPYQAWANTAEGQDGRLAKWALSRYGEIARRLSEQGLPDQCLDADKAQMLLGYLARVEANAPDPSSG